MKFYQNGTLTRLYDAPFAINACAQVLFMMTFRKLVKVWPLTVQLLDIHFICYLRFYFTTRPLFEKALK